MKNYNVNSIFLRDVTHEEVLELVSKLNDSSAGWDNISPSVIKKVPQHVVIPFTHICNLSLITGIVPNELKIALFHCTRLMTIWCYQTIVQSPYCHVFRRYWKE